MDPSLWTLTAEADDPFSDRPASFTCADDAWGAELIGPEMSLHLDTEDCAYLTVQQPSLMEIREGDLLFLRLWHYELTSSDGGEGHAALMTGAGLLWEEYIPIPAESGMSAPEWEADVNLPEGEIIWFHLHNHGSNSWNLIEVSDTPVESL